MGKPHNISDICIEKQISSTDLYERRLVLLNVTVCPGRELTFQANGGRFIRIVDLYEEMQKTGRAYDINEAMEEAPESIPFYTLQDGRWGDMRRAWDWTRKEEGISSGKLVDCSPVRPGYEFHQDMNSPYMLHSGETTAEDIDFINDPSLPDSDFPEDRDTLYYAWTLGKDAETSFLTAGDTIEWPSGADVSEIKEGEVLKGYKYNAKANDVFVFPSVSKLGTEFLGWKIPGTSGKPLMTIGGDYVLAEPGTHFLVSDKVKYETYFKLTELKLNSEDLPKTLKAGDPVPTSDSFSITSSNSSVSARFVGFKAEPDIALPCESGSFTDNAAHYACIELSITDGRQYYSGDLSELSVYLGSEKLLKEMTISDSTIELKFEVFRRYNIGTPQDMHRLTFDLNGKGTLPGWAANGVSFIEGESMDQILSDSNINELDTLKVTEGWKEYGIRWYSDEQRKDALNSVADYDLTTKKSSCTVYGDWEELPHTHKLTHVLALDPTETEPGNIEYWYCECGKYFSDSEGKHEISQADTVIPAKSKEKEKEKSIYADTGSGLDTVVRVSDKGTVYLSKGVSYIFDSAFEWTSSDKKGVAVSKKYIIKAKKVVEGVTLTGTDKSGNKLVCTAFVADPELTVPKAGVLVGESYVLPLKLGKYANKYNVTWCSSDPAVATISENSAIEGDASRGTLHLSSAREKQGFIHLWGKGKGGGLEVLKCRCSHGGEREG